VIECPECRCGTDRNGQAVGERDEVEPRRRTTALDCDDRSVFGVACRPEDAFAVEAGCLAWGDVSTGDQNDEREVSFGGAGGGGDVGADGPIWCP
jgi:hypothetical protein